MKIIYSQNHPTKTTSISVNWRSYFEHLREKGHDEERNLRYTGKPSKIEDKIIGGYASNFKWEFRSAFVLFSANFCAFEKRARINDLVIHRAT